MCQIGLIIGFRGRIQLRMNGLQIKLSTIFTFTAENPYNPPLYSMPSDELNLVRQSKFSKTRQKQRTTPSKLHFSSDLVNMLTNGCHIPEAREHLVCRYRKVSVRRR